jgi:steroid 5-alpha reductase family enzyme
MGFLESFGLGFLILIIIALVVSAVGFYKYVYFISLGYGFSVAVMGLAMLIMYFGVLDWGTTLMCILFMVYGCRLGGYLLIREIKSASYRGTMKKEIKDGSTMKMVAKISIWTSCALLYALQVSPLLFRLEAAKRAGGTSFGEANIVTIIGAVIMAMGILLESAADMQKSAAKKKNPNRFCDSGLYKIVRCPNYLGEVLFWTGVFVSSLDTLCTLGQWLSAIIAYICIVYIMFNGAQRLEKRQMARYGNNQEYKEYADKTPIIIPFLPIYHLNK